MATRPAPTIWRGSARMGLEWDRFVGCAGDGEPHAHHAVQIVLAVSPQYLWTEKGGWGAQRTLQLATLIRMRIEVQQGHKIGGGLEPMLHVDADHQADVALASRRRGPYRLRRVRQYELHCMVRMGFTITRLTPKQAPPQAHVGRPRHGVACRSRSPE